MKSADPDERLQVAVAAVADHQDHRGDSKGESAGNVEHVEIRCQLSSWGATSAPIARSTTTYMQKPSGLMAMPTRKPLNLPAISTTNNTGGTRLQL
jgi:hypothetical protein